MSKAILMSINPRWCELIARGEKTIEVRKTRPKLETPFKVYIYMTAGDASYPVTINGAQYTCHNNGGKVVIGEFVCRNIRCNHVSNLIVKEDAEATLRGTCLTKKEVYDYIGYKFGELIYAKPNLFYCWKISDLMIYDEPKELRKFKKPCKSTAEYEGEIYEDCLNCDWCIDDDYGMRCDRSITRPPQSWCYVEEVEG